MDWIKKNYDQLILAIIATVLAVVSVLLLLQAKSFGERFTGAQPVPIPKPVVPPLDTTFLEEAKAAFNTPSKWQPTAETAFFFVPKLYVVDPTSGTPKQISEGGTITDTLTGKVIPNKWFLDNRLNPLDPKVGIEDADKDSFLNEDEWRHHTDPNVKDSHPAYVTKLFHVGVRRIPFRLKFNAYDGVPTKPDGMTFQINTVDLRQPSEFLKIGETVAKTKFKLKKFEYKEKKNPNTGDMDDASELTVENTETGDQVVLVKEKIVDSPTVYEVFEYQWPQPPKVFEVKRPGEFVLIPETDKRYKLVDIKDDSAQIETPSGEKVTITADPRKAQKK